LSNGKRASPRKCLFEVGVQEEEGVFAIPVREHLSFHVGSPAVGGLEVGFSLGY